MDMLVSIVVELVSKRNVSLPPHLGRANHAALLRQIGMFDPALSRRLHDLEGAKPFTCSSILGATPRRDEVWVEGGRPYTIRFTGLNAEVSEAIKRCWLETPPDAWVLDDHLFRVNRVLVDGSDGGWSGQSTYTALVDRYLEQPALAAPRLTFELASTTAFKSDNVTMPLPLPDLVLGSLANRWQAFSHAPVRVAMRQFAAQHVAVSWFDLHSQAVDQKNRALRIGATGRVAYQVLNDDYLLTANILADFALYAGVGVQTAAGMGQCRRLAPRTQSGEGG